MVVLTITIIISQVKLTLFLSISGPKRLSTPIYLYNDHDSRHLILQQLIRIGEIFDLAAMNQKYSALGSDWSSNCFTISFLSFNMYKFNYEIGKKEYIINGKSERRMRRIQDNHIDNRNSDFDCNEVSFEVNKKM